MLKAPRGTRDIFGNELFLWSKIENIIREIFYKFNFIEIKTPMFENTELFLRSVGNTSDIIQKELYSFLDKSGRNISLKPEGTAGVIRASIENNLFLNFNKLFYFTSCFRYERPQSGRYREFYQTGAEFFCDNNYLNDLEIILLAHEILSKTGLKNIELKINSLGCKNCRKKYDNELKNFLDKNIFRLCDDCNIRFNKNNLRILDCKNKNCQEIISEAPKILDFLCDDCKSNFDLVIKKINKYKIKYEIDKSLVRGLDYYTQIVFEFIYNDRAICGGGRYDNLIKELGGPDIQGVGFAFGFERLLDAIKSINYLSFENNIDFYIATISNQEFEFAQEIAFNLRNKNFLVDYNLRKKNLKSQIKFANSISAQYLIVLGDQERKTRLVKVKNMATRDEKEMDINDIEFF
ncbi:MAG: histidine--tRNA ligase [Clostridiales bacterium]|jgi:histidyl-tRNA synthetase|nr:histidine--tRNA ligase [Clostridiales bacterium]